MNKSRKIHLSWWLGQCLFGLFTHSLVDEWIRPIYGANGDLLSFFLGVAPNFLAAAFIFPFGLLMFREYQVEDWPKELNPNFKRWFWMGLLGSQLGLLVWELMQRSGNLIYDPADMVATVLGGLVAILLFYRVNKRQQRGG